ncbi:fumarylacetoacetate hydrolase family protein [Ruegeria jejuensis]|uniref:fumarylacetoacetate hydrolase family protein n=1 Tax=Ruegeria jejuensis TaxID=3233338 RepID=UPI00355C2755
METLFEITPNPVIPVSGDSRGYPVGRIFCVGRNYEAHAAEMGNSVDREAPFYFTKSPANASLSGATVPYPPGTDDYHHEMELALAIGAEVFRGDADAAQAAIFGYCCALDMTRRDVQIRERQKQRPWDLGKDVESSAVFAPLRRASDWQPHSGSRIHLSVNGEVRQDATLGEMVWSVVEIVQHLSGFYHLRPGDLVLTGTPAGVGPVQPGDRIEGAIDGLDPVQLVIGSPE